MKLLVFSIMIMWYVAVYSAKPDDEKCKKSQGCLNSVLNKLDSHRTNVMNKKYKVGSKKFEEICGETSGRDAKCFNDNLKSCPENRKKNDQKRWDDVKKDIDKECAKGNFGIRMVSSLSLILLALVTYVTNIV